MVDKRIDLSEGAALIADGSSLAMTAGNAPMALVHELVRRGARDLRLICVPSGGINADLLAGAGCLREIETSSVTIPYGRGAGPRFRAGVERGSLRCLDST